MSGQAPALPRAPVLSLLLPKEVSSPASALPKVEATYLLPMSEIMKRKYDRYGRLDKLK